MARGVQSATCLGLFPALAPINFAVCFRKRAREIRVILTERDLRTPLRNDPARWSQFARTESRSQTEYGHWDVCALLTTGTPDGRVMVHGRTNRCKMSRDGIMDETTPCRCAVWIRRQAGALSISGDASGALGSALNTGLIRSLALEGILSSPHGPRARSRAAVFSVMFSRQQCFELSEA